MNTIVLIGLVGSIFSVLTAFIPERLRQKRLFMVLLVFIFVILCGIVTYQNSKIARINQISRSALELANKQGKDFTDLGYVQACLSFLEVNKDLFPDSYNRAQRLYEQHKSNDNSDSNSSITLEYELDGLINGIAILTKEK
jgi:hypothetical protein